MPLLKRKAFEKSAASGYLRDDDEVFHCEITDEIFKDYEEYCERIILVNSMVWSCEMTGKNNLTYAEALESEKAARRSLKDFPMELRIPILFLAAKTKRSSFAEMSEDVFNFVRERFFVGESVEACLEGDTWRESHVLSITVQKQHPGSKTTPPAASYCYEVEQFEEEGGDGDGDGDAGTVGAAPHDRVRRRKGIFSREKCRLFLKQFVEMAPGGLIGIKKAALDKYNISKVNYEQIFVGTPPEFPSSKKLLKTPPASTKKAKPGSTSKLNTSGKPGSATKLNNSAKKGTPDKKKQESMDKFLKKTPNASEGTNQKKTPDPAAKKSAQELADKMRRAEEQMRKRREEEKAKKKEKSAKIQAYLKEWQKVKDDLQLEDHKIIPKGTPICLIDIPQQHVGDFLSVLEFVQLYAEILKTKDVFHHGLDIETFRKMLTMKEHAGAFSDLVQMFMTTIFTLQEDEAEEYNEGGRIAESTQADKVEGEVGVTTAVELATKACKWSQTYLGTPLSKLPLDPTTITEVVRLHILSSGAAPGGRCATWRYQQRGGYSSLDDAGLRLRREHPQLVRRLRTTHCTDLPLDDKFLLLQCLMNQILSYATVRDVIEEKIESYKTMKHELRTMQIAERRREMELVATRTKLKKEAVAKKDEQKLTGEKAREVDKELETELEKLTREGEDKKAQYKKKAHKLQYECFQHHSYIGSDRAYRRYWLNQNVPGLLVEAGDEPRGPCLDKPVPPAARGDDTLAYVTELFETRGGSDKENDSNANSRGNSPKKPLTNLNGLTQKLNGLETNLQQMKELLVCTGDINSCFVHGKGDFRPQWCVYHTEEQIDGLIQSLNKRGIRESDLRTGLEMDKASIVEYIKKCPLHLLNPSVASPVPVLTTSTRHRKYQPSLLVPEDSSVSEALELSLRDYILELEEKIFHGCLGAIKVKDREAWRGTLMLRGYDKQAEYLSWGPNKQYRDDYHLPDGVLKAPLADPDKADIKPIAENKYRDPGHYLGDVPKVNGIKQEGVKVEKVEELGRPAPEVVRGLASALLQIEQGIHHKYLKRPLGLDDKERKEREARGKALDMDALERWEVSLMESASFAQIFLQLFTLDSSVSWGASILNASCRVCRRKTDPDNMLLCDNCNKGHHLYCLKPKLTKVPSGDWFCDQCKPKQERTPRKRRKLFSDEDIEEAVNDESTESLDVDAGVCFTCGSGGRLAAVCVGCQAQYHAECAQPPPGRGARRWLCAACLNPPREQRRCAAEARTNITEYTRKLNDTIPDTSDSEESDDNTVLVQLATRKSRHSSTASPAPALLNGHSRSSAGRARKSKDESLNTSRKSRKSGSRTPVTNGHVAEERGKKRAATALHATELQTLLRDVMKHKDCWPFYEPVDTNDVPDYLKVIEQPMDFTTIKDKLAGGRYATDEQFIADATLVFVNCYTYNQATHPVALAGVRLEEYFNKRCTALSLPTLPNIDLSDAAVDQPQAPQAKRAKTK